MFIFFWVNILIYFLPICFSRWLPNYKIEYGEDLDEYWEALPEQYRKDWVAEEKYTREVLGFETINDDQLDQLHNAKESTKHIENLPSYEMLKNLRYQQLFQFTKLS